MQARSYPIAKIFNNYTDNKQEHEDCVNFDGR